MSIKYRFDAEKALEVLLYITKRVPDMYRALKVLYFADKEHLAKYGRLICGDTYIAMEKGPVPSGVYDIVKHARGDGFCSVNIPIKEAITLQGYSIKPLREANLDYLSESEVECLNSAVEQYGYLSFAQIKKLSHDDAAFKESDENDQIPLEAIVKNLPDSELILGYIANG
jgi:uncharacterized phage-associated protein